MDLARYIPSVPEAALFAVLMISFYIMSLLFFYSSVQVQVRKNSRCYRDKRAATSNGTYTATASNQKGDPLYSVSYNMGAKSFAVNCACPAGDVVNTYPEVDVYNLNTRQAERIDNKVCSCDKQYYSPSYDTLYFSGYPGITRYMNSAGVVGDKTKIEQEADTSFFDNALNNVQG